MEMHPPPPPPPSAPEQRRNPGPLATVLSQGGIRCAVHQEFHQEGPDLSLFTPLPFLLPSTLAPLCPGWALHPELPP